MRYTPPTNFTAVKAIAEATTTADNPATAAETCTIEAVCTPRTETNPARLPCAPLRATMNSTAGPGMTNRTIDAAMNTGSVDSVGIRQNLATEGHVVTTRFRIPTGHRRPLGRQL